MILTPRTVAVIRAQDALDRAAHALTTDVLTVTDMAVLAAVRRARVQSLRAAAAQHRIAQDRRTPMHLRSITY